MQEPTRAPNVGTVRGMAMPDGYVKMLFGMMSQFFIPTQFIQDGVCVCVFVFMFFQTCGEGKKKSL